MGIRRAREDDIDDLYAVCLGTGEDGSDATGLYDDPRLLGEVYVGAYLRHSPAFAWVHADDNDRARGYALAVLDTASFEEELAGSWWPALQARHPLVPASSNPRDAEHIENVHRPPRRASWLIDAYPSHLHLDMLPDVQGGGRGGRMLRTMLDALTEAGSTGVHLGVAPANARAIGFYQHFGFEADPRGSSEGELLMHRAL